MNTHGPIAVREADEGDLGAWQRFVDECPGAGCMHHAGWFLVLRGAFHVQPRYLMAVDRAGSIKGVLPAYFSRSRLTGLHISSLEDGILAADLPAAAALVKEARALRDASKATYLQLRGGPADDVACTTIATVRTVIPMHQSPNSQWAAVKKKTRWSIRQMEKLPMAVECDADLRRLDEFYAAYARRMRDLGTPVIGLDAFHAMRAHLGTERLRLYLIRHREQLIGGMVCILNGERWTDYFAAVNVTAETEFANYLLYWRVIQDAAQQGASHLNLGRSTPGSGVHLFKRKWGGNDTEVPYRFYPAPGQRPRNMGLQRSKEGSGVPQRLWSRLPLPICNRLGPILRKQLPFI